jgi:hypothetical protein
MKTGTIGRPTALEKVWRESQKEIRCLKCESLFKPEDKKSNRICEKCKRLPEWRYGMNDHANPTTDHKVRTVRSKNA